MSFIAIDLTLLFIFVLMTIVFLYTHKKNIARQGLLVLYRTKIGLEIIDYVSKKYSKLIKPLQYVVIVSGYILMAIITWFILKFSWVYLTTPGLAKALKIPVLTPLVPYIDKVFAPGLLPPFYFTYWIIIIAIVAIPHEFFHGIFAKFSKIKVHSTGFGFLGPLIAFFVEPDEKTMNKSKIKDQMAILAAGTFANLLVTIISAIVMILFFYATFVPSGVIFSTYALSPLNNTNLSIAGNVSFGNNAYLELTQNNETYITSQSIQQYINNESVPIIPVYDNSPAFDVQMEGVISKIDDIAIRSYNDLNRTLSAHSPGDSVLVETISGNKTSNYQITLGDNNGRAYLGVGFSQPKRSGLFGWLYSLVDKVKHPEVYYQSNIGEFGIFINDLLWWLFLINLSVALMNMLPLGIFDGGRFFYLTILSITKNKKVAEKAFKVSTWFFLLLVLALMIKWLSIFF